MGFDDRLVVGRVGAGGRIEEKDGLEEIADITLQRCTSNERGLHLLDISNTAFTSIFLTEFAQAMCHNTELREVYLDNCCITDDGVRVLAQGLSRNARHSIKALSMEDNQIHCRGASHVAKFLEQGGSRWASSRRFGGYCAPGSGQGRGLRYLSLKGNSIAGVGAKALAEVLIQNDDSLETLNLESNRVCDWSAGWFAMVLRNHSVLRSLNLCGNPISHDGIEELRSACGNVQALLVVVCPGSNCIPQEDVTQAVEAQRRSAVYLTEAPSPAPAEAAESAAAQHGAGAFRRPSSASRRQGTGTVARRSRPASAASERSAEAAEVPRATSSGPRPPRSGPSSRRGGACSGTRPSRGRCVPPPMPPTTYAVGHVPCTSSGAMAPQSLRERPGERVMCKDEKETATVIVSPSRWRRKPRGALEVHPWDRRRHTSSCAGGLPSSRPQGGGAAAVWGLKRSSSAPGSSVLEERPGSGTDSLMSDRSGAHLAGMSEES